MGALGLLFGLILLFLILWIIAIVYLLVNTVYLTREVFNSLYYENIWNSDTLNKNKDNQSVANYILDKRNHILRKSIWLLIVLLFIVWTVWDFGLGYMLSFIILLVEIALVTSIWYSCDKKYRNELKQDKDTTKSDNKKDNTHKQKSQVSKPPYVAHSRKGNPRQLIFERRKYKKHFKK